MRRLVILLLAAATAGCSTVTAVRVDRKDMGTKGIRYWLPAPHLLVREPIVLKYEEEIFQFDPIENKLHEVCVHECPEDAREVRPTPSTPDLWNDNQRDDPPAPDDPSSSPFDKQEDNGLNGKDDDKDPTAEPTDNPTKIAKDDSGENGGKNTVEKKEEKPVPAKDAVEIVWLPDYCQMYALRARTVLSSQKIEVSLSDGWRLESLTAEQDTTALATKLVEVIGALAAPASVSNESETETSGTEEAQAGEPTYLKRTTTSTLKPGLYALVSYSTDPKDGYPNCDDKRVIHSVALEQIAGAGTETSTSWTEFVLSD